MRAFNKKKKPKHSVKSKCIQVGDIVVGDVVLMFDDRYFFRPYKAAKRLSKDCRHTKCIFTVLTRDLGYITYKYGKCKIV